MNRLIAKYNSPTPKKWVKIGNTMLYLSILLSQSAAFNNYPWSGMVIQALGIIGKVITDFMTDEDNTNTTVSGTDIQLQNNKGVNTNPDKGQSENS